MEININNKTIIQIKYYINAISHLVSNTDGKHYYRNVIVAYLNVLGSTNTADLGLT